MNTTIIAWTLMWLILAFGIYKFIINPQIVIPASVKGIPCPDRWTMKNGLCYPKYETNCVPFDPSKVTSIREKCAIAKRCGTDWGGRCL